MRRPVRQAGMDPHGREESGMRGPERRGHRPARREARDEDPRRIHLMPGGHRLHELGQKRGLAAMGLLIAGPEPVPAALRIVAAALMGIENDQPVPLGRFIHPGAGREILGRLGAAGQHQDEPRPALLRQYRRLESPAAQRSEAAS